MIPRGFILQLLGWGSLIAAAGVSYYYARQSINERRKAQEVAGARPSEKLDCESSFQKPAFQVLQLELYVTDRARAYRAARAELSTNGGRETHPDHCSEPDRSLRWRRPQRAIRAEVKALYKTPLFQ